MQLPVFSWINVLYTQSRFLCVSILIPRAHDSSDQSHVICIYGACLKWLFPELSIPAAGQKDHRVWGRECCVSILNKHLLSKLHLTVRVIVIIWPRFLFFASRRQYAATILAGLPLAFVLMKSLNIKKNHQRNSMWLWNKSSVSAERHLADGEVYLSYHSWEGVSDL